MSEHQEPPRMKNISEFRSYSVWTNYSPIALAISGGVIVFILMWLITSALDAGDKDGRLIASIVFGTLSILVFRPIFKGVRSSVNAAEVAEAEKLQKETYQREVKQYEAALHQQKQREMELQRIQEQKEAEERRQREFEENRRLEQKDRELRAKIQDEEKLADEQLSKSSLVFDIAKCTIPFFRRIIDNKDRESHIVVRIRFGIDVGKNAIEYYDFTNPNSKGTFVFRDEGIFDILSPIQRKSLCKALVTEIRGLLFEAYPTDPNGQKIQIGLEKEVQIISHLQYSLGDKYTAPEYDDDSYAQAVVLYQTFIDKNERHLI